MKKYLLVDNDNETLVNLPSGKISKREKRVNIKSQESMSCVLYAMRRISFFNNPDVKDTTLYQAFRTLKRVISEFKGNYDIFLIHLRAICTQLNLPMDRYIAANLSFSESQKSEPKTQCALIYEALIKQRFCSLLNTQESNWHPKNGFVGLKKSLSEHGAHVFFGKYGSWCHVGKNKLVSFTRESTPTREVNGFQKNSFRGDSVPWTHSIIVDQVKIVDGKEMVFFRDPYDASSQSSPEKIYMISYETFIERLTTQKSQRFIKNECREDQSFGFVSSNPSNLLIS